MRRARVANRWKLRFSMTPMIDVIFLLIIFFLCVNQYQKAESNEAVELPEASSDRIEIPDQTSSRLVINVLPDQTILVAGQVVAAAELAELLAARKWAVGQGVLEVWIRADRKAPYGAVEPVLLGCAKSGVWKVAFKVRRSDD